MINRPLRPLSWLLLLLSTLWLLQGCSNQYSEETLARADHLNTRLTTLGKKLDTGQLTHALLVKNYADKLQQTQPDLAPITQALAKDATTAGALYQGLTQRLQQLNRSPQNKEAFIGVMEEVHSLEAATDPAIFNDALLDLVNTLADLSAGELPRINIPQRSETEEIKGESVPGSYLVGNPNYGSWSQGGSGGGFWTFYGQYRMLSDLMGVLGGSRYGRGGIEYNDWNSRSHHSYHRDYGRDLYGSASDRTRTRSANRAMEREGLKVAKPKRKYGSAAGQKRRSTYTTRRSDFKQRASRKYGASGGPRHADSRSRRSSNLASNRTTSRSSNRASSLFGSSARSSSRSSRGFGGFGGK